MLKDARFELFGVYPICYWSGKLGPKEREGDRQAPEGFYSVGIQQLHLIGRHPRSLNIGFPNAFDRASNRTGSYILVHGGCTSVGCFAMTDPVMEQIYTVSEQALYAGQDKIQVQIFPFRMTEANLAAEAGNRWYGFWRNLKQGYDVFETTRTPPAVGVCRKDYVIAPEWDGDLATTDDCENENPIVTSSMAAPKLAHRPRSHVWPGRERYVWRICAPAPGRFAARKAYRQPQAKPQNRCGRQRPRELLSCPQSQA